MTLTPRTVGLIVVAALASGWFGATVTHDATVQQPRVPNRTPMPIGVTTVPQAEKLRERLNKPPLPRPGRNPFVYGARVAPRRSSGDRADQAEMPAAAPVAMPAAPPLPVIKLSGIATDVKDGVTVLTAILNDNGSMVFAKAGDKLSNGSSVVSVDELSVTIIDADGVTQTIRLP